MVEIYDCGTYVFDNEYVTIEAPYDLAYHMLNCISLVSTSNTIIDGNNANVYGSMYNEHFPFTGFFPFSK